MTRHYKNLTITWQGKWQTTECTVAKFASGTLLPWSFIRSRNSPASSWFECEACQLWVLTCYVTWGMGYIICVKSIDFTCQHNHMHLIIIILSIRYRTNMSRLQFPKGHARLKRLQHVNFSKQVFGSKLKLKLDPNKCYHSHTPAFV